MAEFGKKFRKARESKELSLEAVSNVTKIGARMLQAIEDEDFDRLPGGVFNKGFIRAYAKHLGLDPETAITEYLDCLRNAQVSSHEGWDSAHPDPRVKGAVATMPAAKIQAAVELKEELPNLQLPRAEDVRSGRKQYMGRRSPGIPWTLVYLVAIVIIAVAILWIRHSRAIHNAADKFSTPASAAASSSPVPTSSAPTMSRVPPSATAPAAHSPAFTRAIRPGIPNPAANQIKSTSQDQVKADVTMRSYGTATATPAESSAENLTLTIRATENTWISVSSDGNLVTQENLIAPAHPKFHAARELVVRVGNAAGVSFVWNGEEFPPQGGESEAKTFLFDAQGMRASVPNQTAH